MTAASVPELVPEGGWAGADRVRLAPPPPPARGALFRSLSGAARLFGRNDMPDVITVLHANPRLFWPWLLFASRLMPFGKLPAALREKVILRMAWLCRSRYEWGQHVEIALRCGVTDAEIVALSRGPDTVADAPERAVLRACDELCREQCVSPATWTELAGHFREPLLIELLLLAGHYQMLAGFLNSAGLVLEPPIEAALQAFHERVAAG